MEEYACSFDNRTQDDLRQCRYCGVRYRDWCGQDPAACPGQGDAVKLPALRTALSYAWHNDRTGGHFDYDKWARLCEALLGTKDKAKAPTMAEMEAAYSAVRG